MKRKMASEIVKDCKNDGKDYSVYTTFNEIKLINAKIEIQDFNSNKNSKFIPIIDSKK